ncbi:MAG TPA: ribonuclease domain-containing protein [Lysobacter sp.]|nr:ribonuclease domain-containing protein [Lysobacter sp.]
MRRPAWIFLALFVLLGLWLWSQQRAPAPTASAPSTVAALPQAASVHARAADDATVSRYPAFLPVEAHAVLQRIAHGGPYPFRQDGSVFQNREHRLPAQPRGYYHEYTVATPGASDRGARRIITGGEPPREYWYTDDHYRSFRRFGAETAEVSR